MGNPGNLSEWKRIIMHNNQEIENWKDKRKNAGDGLVASHDALWTTDGTKEDYIKFCNKMIAYYEEQNDVFSTAIDNSDLS